MITNCLKKVLPIIILKIESYFIPRILITDNVLVAFETIHPMKTQSNIASSMALKLDMSKVYDKVEWIFLKKIMLQMGFHPKWIYFIIEFVSTITYYILVNGEPQGFITPTRGLRHGDSLSPYLFLIYAEGLHAFITQASLAG